MGCRREIGCIKQGNCLAANGEEPLTHCPAPRERYIERSPLLLAESLCLSALADKTPTRARNRFKDKFDEIQYDLEYALALPRHMNGALDEKEFFMESVVHKIRDIQQSADERDPLHKDYLSYYLKFRHLTLLLPAYTERIWARWEDNIFGLQSHPLQNQESRPHRATVAAIHGNLCGFLKSFDEEIIRKIPSTDHSRRNTAGSAKKELEVSALLSRLGFMVYMGLEREEASHVRSQHNHDLYLIHDDQKIPLQVKNTRNENGYDKVVLIKHYDIMRAMKRDPQKITTRWNPKRDDEDYEWPSSFVHEQPINGTKPTPITDLLVEEMEKGKSMDPDKRNELNLASWYLIARINDYIRKYLA